MGASNIHRLLTAALKAGKKFDLASGDKLIIKPVVDDQGSIEIGDGTLDMDLKVFLGSTSDYILFDRGNSKVELAGSLLLDASGNKLTTEEGSGITSGTGVVYASSIQRMGGIIKTTILIDLTGLNSSAAAGIIGVDGAANSHFGQITLADCGTILAGQMKCLEVPATGEPDIDIYSADESTGAEDATITTLTETAILLTGVDWTLNLQKGFGTIAANQYLYLVGSGAGTSATYTAGQFLIELWGTA